MKKIMTISLIMASIASVGIANIDSSKQENKTNTQCKVSISKHDIQQAQQQWAQSIIAIGHDKNPQIKAQETLDTLYGYDMGEVMFKPTLAAQDQFRLTKDEALSYFIGGKNKEDQGFALRGFTDIRFDNEHVTTHCDVGMAMGNYYFQTKEGEKLKVEYSFAYQKLPNNQVKIILHHSSLPYQPSI